MASPKQPLVVLDLGRAKTATPSHFSMNPTQANSQERLQQAIEAKIKSFEEAVRALRLRCNALSPVHLYPFEVFPGIFTFLCVPASSLGGKPNHHSARLRVSHVCHREIAINQPLLWSHVDFNTLKLAGATEIFVRAKSVPLYLEVRISGLHWDDVRFTSLRKELQARIPQIRHLNIGAKPHHLHK